RAVRSFPTGRSSDLARLREATGRGVRLCEPPGVRSVRTSSLGQQSVSPLAVLLGGNPSRRELGVEMLQLVLPGHRNEPFPDCVTAPEKCDQKPFCTPESAADAPAG